MPVPNLPPIPQTPISESAEWRRYMTEMRRIVQQLIDEVNA